MLVSGERERAPFPLFLSFVFRNFFLSFPCFFFVAPSLSINSHPRWLLSQTEAICGTFTSPDCCIRAVLSTMLDRHQFLLRCSGLPLSLLPSGCLATLQHHQHVSFTCCCWRWCGACRCCPSPPCLLCSMMLLSPLSSSCSTCCLLHRFLPSHPSVQQALMQPPSSSAKESWTFRQLQFFTILAPIAAVSLLQVVDSSIPSLEQFQAASPAKIEPLILPFTSNKKSLKVTVNN